MNFYKICLILSTLCISHYIATNDSSTEYKQYLEEVVSKGNNRLGLITMQGDNKNRQVLFKCQGPRGMLTFNIPPMNEDDASKLIPSTSSDRDLAIKILSGKANSAQCWGHALFPLMANLHRP